MKFMLLVAFFLSLGGTLVLGVRLVRAGMRSRATPELVYGSALLLAGIGSIVRVIVYGVLGVSDETRFAVVFAALFAMATLAVTTTGLRLIFHPFARWPHAVQALLLAIAATGVWNLATGPIDSGVRPVSQLLGDVANTGMMLWGAVESFAYWNKLRRRRRLGIADPVVTEQFKLWGLGFSAGVFGSGSLWLTPVLLGRRMLDVPAISIGVNLALVAMTAFLWMAFYPPKSYRRRVEGRFASAA
jgi:hypothetical protein